MSSSFPKEHFSIFWSAFFVRSQFFFYYYLLFIIIIIFFNKSFRFQVSNPETIIAIYIWKIRE